MFSLVPRQRSAPSESDVCLITEGCYPHVAGGVSTWTDWLMRSCQDTTFSVISVVMASDDRKPRYDFPENLLSISELVLDDYRAGTGGRSRVASEDAERLATTMCRFILKGELEDLAWIVRFANDPGHPRSLEFLTHSPFAWQVCVASYKTLMPQASFKDFFWAWQALTGGLFAVVKADLPKARTYHALSTGYAGLLAARAKIEGAGQVIVTEHGIYTNERQIEILMADWIDDTIDKGLALADSRFDLRDLWTVAFKSFARACYAGCDRILTLFDANQAMQRALGAPENKLSVIPNGIDVDRFGAITRASEDTPPTVALIGRIVPIKDIKTFLRAANIVRTELPQTRFLIAGPAEEAPDYAADCRRLVTDLGLEDHVTFTGRVDTAELLSRCHVVALTSVSEAQPLCLLEAGAAGLPCVATDVGSCRELLLGTGKRGNTQPGGFVAGALDAPGVASHLVTLLRDPDLRSRLGRNLRQRVNKRYRADEVAEAYRRIYAWKEH